MIYRCQTCGAVTATAGPEMPRLECQNCGTVLHENPHAPPLEDIAFEPCPELLLLPAALRGKSLSTGEILLTAEFALQAIDALEQVGALLDGCDCLVGTDERWRYLTAYPGLKRIPFSWLGSRRKRVARAAQACRSVIREHQERFSATSHTTGESLYFSIIVKAMPSSAALTSGPSAAA